MTVPRLPLEFLSAPPFVPEQLEFLAYGRIAEEVEGCLAVGLEPNVEMLITKFPEYEQQVRELFPTLAALYELGHDGESQSSLPSTSLPQPARIETAASGILGDYRIGREIGRGGMAIVYEAVQISLNRRVALKVLPFAAVLDQKQLQRFRNEAQAAAGLHHQHIVPVYAVGCERGVHYYAMQYIEGQNLWEIIRLMRQRAPSSTPGELGLRFTPTFQDVLETRRLSGAATEQSSTDYSYFRTVAELGIQAAEALEYAHARGVVHRDIKPSNIILDTERKLWITDFGLARLESGAELTGTGVVVGTLRYMSPEQAFGRLAQVDHRSDIYSLGATLYELLTLEPLHSGINREELMQTRSERKTVPPREINSDIPADLETIILTATVEELPERYQTAQELADDLRRFVLDKPIATPAHKPVKRRPATTRWKRPAIIAAVVLVGIGLFGAGMLAARRGEPAAASALVPSSQANGDDQPFDRPFDVPRSWQQPNTERAGSDEPVERHVAVREQHDLRLPMNVRIDDHPVAAPQPVGRLGQDTPSIAPKPAESKPAQQPAVQPPLVLVVTSPPEPVFREPRHRDEYVRLLERLLEAGFEQGRDGYEAALRHGESARKLCSTDPRLDYSLGLVHLKHFRNEQAIELIEAAADDGPYPYPPAWKTLVVRHVLRKQYEEAAGRLFRLAQVLEQSPDEWPDEPAKQECAHWLGRSSALLSELGRIDSADLLLADRQRVVGGLLRGDRRRAFDAGRRAAEEQVEELTAAGERFAAELSRLRTELSEEQRTELDDEVKHLDGRREKLNQTAAQWRKWLDDETGRVDRTLRELEREYIRLEEQAKSLDASMAQVRQEMSLLAQSRLDAAGQSASGQTLLPPSASYDRAWQYRAEQLRRFQQEYTILARQAASIQQKAAATVSERRKIVERYEQATGKLAEQSQTLKQWERRLDARTEKLDREPDDNQASKLKELADRARAIRGLFRVDFDAERRAILESWEAVEK